MKKLITIFIFSAFILNMPFFVKAQTYPDDTLLKAEDDAKVYVIKNDKRKWIPNATIFNEHGYKWNMIKVVPKSALEKYPRVRLIRAKDDSRIFYITESEMKRHIINVEVFLSYGNKWDDVVEVSPLELNTYPDNFLIRDENNKIYKIENGVKRWIKSAEVFNLFGYDWSKIAPCNLVELNAYPTGDSVEEEVKPTPEVKPASEVIHAPYVGPPALGKKTVWEPTPEKPTAETYKKEKEEEPTQEITEFIKTTGGAYDDYGNSVQQTSDGGYIVVGDIVSGAGQTLLLAKYDNKGNLEWARETGSEYGNHGNSVQQTSDGGYIVTGGTNKSTTVSMDLLLIKYDSKGNLEWTRTAGGTDDDWGKSVQQTSDGGYIVAGTTFSFGAGDQDFFLVKYDSKGNLEWSRTAGGTDDDRAYSVRQTSDGGYVMVGDTSNFGAGNNDLFLVKYDSKGNLEWARTIGGRGYDFGNSVQQTSDGGYIVSGSTNSFGIGNYDLFLVKYDSKGNLEWAKTAGGTDVDSGRFVQQTFDGGYIVTGNTLNFGASSSDLFLVKYDSKGDLEWARTAGGVGDEYGDSVQQALDGGYIMVGYTRDLGAGKRADLFLVKTDSSGNISGCGYLKSVTPTIISPSPTTTSPSPTINSPSPTTASPSFTTTSSFPTSTTQCPAEIEKEEKKEEEPKQEITEFVKTTGGIGYDHGRSVHQTSDGGYIVFGDTNSFGAGSVDLFLVKYDSKGNIEWVKTTGGTYNDYGHSAQQTSDGGYIVIGRTMGFGAGSGDLFLVKYDSKGNLEWAKTAGGTNEDSGSSVQQTSDGGYIVIGETDSFSTDIYRDLFLVKYDSKGDLEWARTAGSTHGNYSHSVQQTSDGGYIVAGDALNFGEGWESDLLLVKYDSKGNLEWAKTAGGTGYDSGSSVQQTSDGGYIVVGKTQSFGAGSDDLFLVKYDNTGNLEWAKTTGGTYNDSGSSVQQTSDGGYIATGIINSHGTDSGDLFLVKYDSKGNLEWAKTAGGTGYDSGSSVQQTSDGGYIITGDTKSFGASNNDFFLLKTDSNGNISGCEYLKSVAPTTNSPSPIITSPSLVTASPSPTTTSPSPTVTSPFPTSTTQCPAGIKKEEEEKKEEEKTKEVIGFLKTAGGTDWDYSGNSVQQTSDGGYIVTGQTRSFGAGDRDLLLVKYNSQGNIEWARTAGGTNEDSGSSVQQTSDGGYIVAGKTGSFGAGNSNLFLVKYDSKGNIEWARKTENINSSDYYSYSVQQTSDGGYIVVGDTSSFGTAGISNLFLVKYDSKGDLKWAKTTKSISFDSGGSIQQTSDGGYIVAGETRETGTANDLLLVKYDSEGNFVWARTAGSPGYYDWGKSVQQTSDGGYIVVGITQGLGVSKGDKLFLVKYDNKGNLEWARTAGGEGADSGSFVRQTSDGGYIVVGDTSSFGTAGISDIFLVKYNSKGEIEWAKTVGGPQSDSGHSVQQTSDGGYIITGDTKSFGAGNNDFFLLKTDSNGNISGCEYLKSVAPTTNSPSPIINSPSLTTASVSPSPPNIPVSPTITFPSLTSATQSPSK